jgi:serine/threonine-protein kinase
MFGTPEIHALSSGSLEWKKVGEGQFGRYLPSGHLVYLDHGAMYAVAFDLDRLETRGTPVQVWQNIPFSIAGLGVPLLDFSRNGTMVYRPGESAGRTLVQWLDAAGKAQRTLLKPGGYARPRLSPDGRRLAVAIGVFPAYDILT